MTANGFGMAVYSVREWMDTRGFPRTQIPALPREVSKAQANEFARSLRNLLDPVAIESEFRNRTAMVLEELAEMFEAIGDGNLPAYADAVTDLLWVVISIGVATGLPLEDLWSLVADANFDKEVGGTKPPGWRSPQAGITALLKEKGGITCRTDSQIQ